jgi:hypothetical protein
MKMSRWWRRWLVMIAVGLGGLALSGCTTVQPWERGTLADAVMNPDRDPLRTAMTEHLLYSREASTGGRGVGGSGCGCN